MPCRSLRCAAATAVALGAGPAWADCDAPLPALAVSEGLDQAAARYRDLDLDGFRSAMDRVAAELPCLTEPMTPALALRTHQLQGLRSYVLDDRDRAQQAFLAARRVSPDSRLPADLIPAEHPVRQRYGALPLDAAGSQPVARPKSGALHLDGAPAAARPTAAPVVFQVQADDGAVAHTRYLWPDEPLPAYPRARTRAQRAWLWSGIATGLAGAAAYGGAWVTRGRYDDPSTPAADLNSLRATTNALGWTGVALGTAGAGLVVTGLLPDT